MSQFLILNRYRYRQLKSAKTRPGNRAEGAVSVTMEQVQQNHTYATIERARTYAGFGWHCTCKCILPLRNNDDGTPKRIMEIHFFNRLVVLKFSLFIKSILLGQRLYERCLSTRYTRSQLGIMLYRKCPQFLQDCCCKGNSSVPTKALPPSLLKCNKLDLNLAITLPTFLFETLQCKHQTNGDVLNHTLKADRKASHWVWWRSIISKTKGGRRGERLGNKY